ncbi:hypothetical protein AB0C13_29010 [Streptomyces sp. NPDC049099]|uniref:hypothetical protein n=1 Tax=Streptomyces sp. NPDC049099 TaxID=3155768 RepID=UPI0034335B0F
MSVPRPDADGEAFAVIADGCPMPREDRQLGGQSEAGGRSYHCVGESTEWWVGPGERLVWSFGLRIEKASALKPGKVLLKVLPEHDSDPKNDTAAITVKVPGAAGDTGGSDGGGSGTSKGPTGGTSGSGSGGGSGSPGGVHDTSPTSTPTGSMAGTGAGSLPWIAATTGVVAVGVGTVLFLAARRRRRS